jgi:hypothetical protein
MRDANDVLREQGGEAVRGYSDRAKPYRNGSSAPGYGHNSGATPLFREVPVNHGFPDNALGEVLGDAARAFEAATRAPMAICATAALSVATLAAQAHADIQLPTGQTSLLSEFFFTIARSGERKTANDSRALEPARLFERDLAETYKFELDEYERKAAAYEAQKKEILSPKSKLDFEGKQLALKKLGDAPTPPIKPHLTMGDLTAEGAAKYLLHYGYPSIGIFTTEGGQLVGGHGFTPEAKLRTAAFFNRLWDAGRVERFRAGEAIVTSGKRVSMHVQIQDDIASAFFSDPILANVGLLGRILATDPPSTQGSRAWREPDPYHQIAIARYVAHIQAIFRVPLPLKEGSGNELAPRVLTMTASARARWIAFHD